MPPDFEPPRQGLRDWVFFGVIDWHFRHQRPQQLALALAARGHRVFYVSPEFEAAGAPNVRAERLHPNRPVWQVRLQVPSPPVIYTDVADAQRHAPLRAGLAQLWQQADIRSAVCVVQHPFWLPFACGYPEARLVYDCMDHHAGFSNTASDHHHLEQQLFARADLTVVSSDFLAQQARGQARRVAIIRNACEFEHFHRAAPSGPFAAPSARGPRRIIGYYGAIAEWFDVELVARLASDFGEHEILLIGADTAGVGARLRRWPNVRMVGEQPYAELPRWLAQFDVCLIPFLVTPLTLATNPVKVYEYLCAGKPVVAVDLPELRPMSQWVYLADTADGFAKQVRAALDEVGAAEADALPSDRQRATALSEQRVLFARGQTWEQRVKELARCGEDAGDEPLVSVVVLSYNKSDLTQRCLESLERCRDGSPMQVVVVDNASVDDSVRHLEAWQAEHPGERDLVVNAVNRGFSGGVNDGLARCRGDFLVVLNNDTVVTPGWMRGLRRHLQADPSLGLVCPVTNNIGNEAQIALPSGSVSEVCEYARAYTLDRAGSCFPLRIAAFFCVMMPRGAWEAVGALDERFFPGFFEDDDYCLRLAQQGWRVGCAEDVFVYHELSASFDAEGARRKQEIFERNKTLFEQKWGRWQPHVYRPESVTPTPSVGRWASTSSVEVSADAPAALDAQATSR
jgi:GT2 family glycosyltransferase/glycosyltransferase involved in cell wall biosynthesis